MERLNAERRRTTTFQEKGAEEYVRQSFTISVEETVLTRKFDPAPFVPAGKEDRDARCEEILMIQAMGLKKRVEHARSKSLVSGNFRGDWIPLWPCW